MNQATRRAYLIASNPRLNQYGALAYIWPNPYGWTGPFVVADTGSDFNGAGRLDFYVFMGEGESWQQALGRAYQWGPANQVKLSAAPIRAGGPTISGPLGLGPADLGPGGTPPPLGGPSGASVDVGPVLNLGDSLAVGSGPPLAGKLEGRTVTTLAARNRTSSQGLAVLRRVADVPRTLVVQLGTNDTDVRRFRANVRSVLAIARRASARVLWINVARPVLDGTRDTELNEVLTAESARHDELQVLDWKGAVTSGRVQLGDDVHPSGDGYSTRAQLIADALADSAGAGTAGGCGDPVAPGSLGELSGTAGADRQPCRAVRPGSRLPRRHGRQRARREHPPQAADVQRQPVRSQGAARSRVGGGHLKRPVADRPRWTGWPPRSRPRSTSRGKAPG